MGPVLLADIGATNSRFALYGDDGRPTQVVKFRGDEVASFEAAIARYHEEVGVETEGAVMAIAAPVEGDAVTMTNRTWHFRFSDLAKRFGWRHVQGLNDFEAVAWGLLRLTDDDVEPLGPPALATPRGVKVVFGPGTGLGVAALVPVGEGASATWQVIPTEGGHVSFGPASPDEAAAFEAMHLQHGPVSAEMILSGPGLERLHRAMHRHADLTRAERIVAQAHAGDRESAATVTLFVRLFGRFAGDLALMFRATGGVHVGGGVARRIGSMLDAGSFRAAFERHPPYEAMLQAIPTTLITYDEPGLLGCALLAERAMIE